MQSAIPVEFITTSEADAELMRSDGQWLSLRAQWDSATNSQKFALDGLIIMIEERQTILRAFLRDAVANQQIEPVALVGDPTSVREFRLAWDWRDLPGDLSLISGRVRGSSSESAEIRQLDGCPLCFRRGDWRAWLAVCSRGGDETSDATSKENAAAWLAEEMGRRRRTGRVGCATIWSWRFVVSIP